MASDIYSLRVGVYGYGAIGRCVVKRLMEEPTQISLIGVSSFNQRTLANRLDNDNLPVRSFALEELVKEIDVFVDCGRGTNFMSRVKIASKENCSIVTVNAAAVLLNHKELERILTRTRNLIVASGALPGLDGISGLSQGHIKSVLLVTSKPVVALQDAKGFISSGFNAADITKPTKIFSGSPLSAASEFPANANVAAAVALAGAVIENTRVEIWADPDTKYNTHKLTVESAIGCMSVQFEGYPFEENPKTSALTAYSVLAAVKKMNASIVIGG